MRGSSIARARSAVASLDRSSTTYTRSTSGGIPATVSAISSSSLYAGTTTATRLPSSIRPRTLHSRAAGEPAREAVPQERRGDSGEEAEERADDGRVPLAAGRRLRDRGP